MLIDSTSYLFDFNEIIDLDTEVMEIFRKTEAIRQKFPKIERAIEFDLDNHGLKKKELRIQVKKYNEAKRSQYYLFDTNNYESIIPSELKSGRPRMKSDILLFFLAIRGLWGTISDHQASERIKDSISINSILAMYGYSVPGINTIRENLNAISISTRELILKCQAMLILEKGLDDFSAVYIDSTDVKGNTAFPTDISILHGFSRFLTTPKIIMNAWLLKKEFFFSQANQNRSLEAPALQLTVPANTFSFLIQ